jgi:hypothetical protein
VGKDVRSLQFVITSFQGTADFDLTGFNFALQIGIYAFLMKYMPALEYSKEVPIYLATANRTFPSLRFPFLSLYLIGFFLFLKQFLQGFLALQ